MKPQPPIGNPVQMFSDLHLCLPMGSTTLRSHIWSLMSGEAVLPFLLCGAQDRRLSKQAALTGQKEEVGQLQEWGGAVWPAYHSV